MSQTCLICGASVQEQNHWVHCPKHRAPVCMGHCYHPLCEHKRDSTFSINPCLFGKPRPEAIKPKEAEIEMDEKTTLAIAEIERQAEAGISKNAQTCARQLANIVRSTPGAGELVLQDLQGDGMGVVDCEKKISDFARKHQGILPEEADKIIREFYGLPEGGPAVGTPALSVEPAPQPKPAAQQSGNFVNLADLL